MPDLGNASVLVARLVVARPRFWHQRRENTKFYVKQLSDSDPEGDTAHIKVTFGHGRMVLEAVRQVCWYERDLDDRTGRGLF